MCMGTFTFEWDEHKNILNQLKHKIASEEAMTVFYDVNAVSFDDPERSSDEERFLIIGISEKEKLCIVSHCYRGKDDNIIRIISARKATKKETKYYCDNRGRDEL